MNQERQLPNWKQIYQDTPVESMPWFNPDLDPDIDSALTKLNLQTGKVLDIGTGPGTQAMALAQRGFQVTATDISEAAIEQAQAKAQAKGLNISWQEDDILNTQISGEFDLILDRGCFHVFHADQRQDYLRVVNNLTKPKGYLFLKCFSHLETREEGPYRFIPEEINEMFSPQFNIISIEQTVYYGRLDPRPKALFCIMEKPKQD
jgi:cyclopropane fatty-acyl-phospholipid synthase-like methyltransferase